MMGAQATAGEALAMIPSPNLSNPKPTYPNLDFPPGRSRFLFREPQIIQDHCPGYIVGSTNILNRLSNQKPRQTSRRLEHGPPCDHPKTAEDHRPGQCFRISNHIKHIESRLRFARRPDNLCFRFPTCHVSIRTGARPGPAETGPFQAAPGWAGWVRACGVERPEPNLSFRSPGGHTTALVVPPEART